MSCTRPVYCGEGHGGRKIRTKPFYVAILADKEISRPDEARCPAGLSLASGNFVCEVPEIVAQSSPAAACEALENMACTSLPFSLSFQLYFRLNGSNDLSRPRAEQSSNQQATRDTSTLTSWTALLRHSGQVLTAHCGRRKSRGKRSPPTMSLPISMLLLSRFLIHFLIQCFLALWTCPPLFRDDKPRMYIRNSVFGKLDYLFRSQQLEALPALENCQWWYHS